MQRLVSAAIAIAIVGVFVSQSSAQPDATPSILLPRTPATVTAEIDWRSVTVDLRSGRLTGYALPPDAVKNMRDGVAPTPALPVLLPADTSLLRDISLLYFPNSYAASGRVEGVAVAVNGTRVLQTIAPGDPLERAIESEKWETLSDGTPYHVTVGEGGVDLTFNRFGAAYLISVECRTLDDVRCNKPYFAVSLVQKMVIVNPGATAP